MHRDIRSSDDLSSYLQSKGLSWESCSLPPKESFAALFPVRMPTHYADLIDWTNPTDPLRLMVLPDLREKDIQPYEMHDPIGDHNHEPVRGLIHRYPDRVLLLLTSFCGVHCRFCFRRDVIGTVMPVDIEGIKTYFATHTEIREVIFSGGDPATFPPEFFESVMAMITATSHIRIVRVHTRALVVDPAYCTDAWLDAFLADESKEHVVVLHINHAREVTPELIAVVKKLKSHGVSVLAQTVLLKGVNDTKESLSSLFRSLSEHGIKAYYLHHLDKARGIHHFRLSIEDGKKLFSSLRGTLSGHALPEYVLDLPGGDGKVPVMWMRRVNATTYEVENYEGTTITYIDPMGVEI